MLEMGILDVADTASCVAHLLQHQQWVLRGFSVYGRSAGGYEVLQPCATFQIYGQEVSTYTILACHPLSEIRMNTKVST